VTAGGPGDPASREAALFDRLADTYDAPALRYVAFSADQLVTRLAPAPGDKVLDVGAGTGAATLAAAQAVGPSGRVVAVDVSEGMLARLEQKLRKFGINNVDIHVMDGSRLDFRRDYFHHVVCAFAIFHMRDVSAALREWQRVLRPGGRLMFSCLGPRTFEPLRAIFFDQLATMLGRRPGRVTWLTQPQGCRNALERAGYCEVRADTGTIRYHLNNPDEWWDILQSLPWSRFLRELDATTLATFRAAHLAEVRAAAGPDGLPIEVEVNYAGGRKP